MSQYDVAGDMDYDTPPGQRPTLNSFLLWVAKRRNIPGASIWVTIPFYLAQTEDPKAWRATIDFLDKRLGLKIDFRELDEEVARQNEKIIQLRNHFPELDDIIHRLESGLASTLEENRKLAEEIEEFLRKRD